MARIAKETAEIPKFTMVRNDIGLKSTTRRSACEFLLALGIVPLLGIQPAAGGEPVSIAEQSRWGGPKNALYRHLCDAAFALLDQRRKAVASIQTAAGWRARQRAVRQMLRQLVGPFPVRTQLRAKIVGTIQGAGFRVEKLIFQSQPEVYVTAAVFVPNGLTGRAPAILYCSGHSGWGFRARIYQRAILNLARKGFIVLAFDPVGQGERLQYYDTEKGGSRIGSPTQEHSYPGAQMLLVGDSLARYMIWDCIRAVDYVLTRPDVDPARIGATGRSGGGTQSAYIAAFDERIKAVAPENYITNFRCLFETIGPQDAEQNFTGSIAHGFDHPDLLTAHAPKPALLIATTRDMFSIVGTRETFHEARRAYSALGDADALQMVEDDARHASTLRNREAMYRFFQRVFSVPGSAAEEAIEPFAAEALNATRTGQVSTAIGGKTLYMLNRATAVSRVEALEASRRDVPGHRERVLRAARALSGYLPPAEHGPIAFSERQTREGYTVESYTTKGEGKYTIPLYLLVPAGKGPHPAVLYLHPDGKSAALRAENGMETLVRQGYAVLAPDLIGLGTMGPGDFKGDSYSFGVGRGAYNIWFAAMQVGRSLVGLRAGDTARTLRVLRLLKKIDNNRIIGIAAGPLGAVMLHAAAFESMIQRVALVGSFLSYESLVLNEYYAPEFIHAAVPSALTAYDLPDLASSLAPRNLLLLNAVDHVGEAVEPARVADVYAVTRDAYRTAERSDAMRIERTAPGNPATESLLDWLRRTDG